MTADRDTTGGAPAPEPGELERLRREVESLRRELAGLRDAESRFRVMADTAPVMIWMARPDRLCDWFNKPWLDFTGRTLEEEWGDGWTAGVHPDDLARCLDVYTSHFDRREPFRMEYRLRRRDGEYRWLLDTGTPRYDAAGEFAGFVGSCIDVHEMKQLEEQLLQSQKMEGIGRLAGGIAHDFRNVLTGITGFGSFLLRAMAPDDRRRRDVEQILKAAARGEALTEQLLTFSRRAVVQPAVLDLNAVIAELAPMLSRTLGEQVRLQVVPGPYLGRILADRTQVEQVVLNLALNARDAMPDGGTLTIETHNVELDRSHVAHHLEAAPGSYVMLAVSDTGQGMDAETRRRIFEPFFTTKPRGQGTGLGLSTVYGIVKQAGGSIWVYSEPGQGTTVKTFFPRTEAPAVEPAVEAEADAALRGRETVLLVEDDESVLALATRVLEEHGYTVLAAPTPEAALRLADAEGGTRRIDLLLADLVLPGMNGAELAARLGRSRPGLRVLYTSGYTEHTVVQRGVLAAGAPFVPKPFLPETLLRRVREALDAPAPPVPR